MIGMSWRYRSLAELKRLRRVESKVRPAFAGDDVRFLTQFKAEYGLCYAEKCAIMGAESVAACRLNILSVGVLIIHSVLEVKMPKIVN